MCDPLERGSNISSVTFCNGNSHNVRGACPLQGYNFRCPAEQPKEHRMSLGEFFTKEDESRMEDEKHESAVFGEIENPKTQPFASFPRSFDVSLSSSAHAKLYKILGVFHRKIHPERKEIKDNDHSDGGTRSNGDQSHPFNHAIVSKRFLKEESIQRQESHLNPLPFALNGSDCSARREHWIKTDADYVVLELSRKM